MTHAHTTPAPQGAADEMTLTDLAARLLRYPRLVVVLPLALGVASLVYFLLFGSYVSQSSFSPEQAQFNLSALAGLAAQFGANLRIPTGNQDESVDFYEELLKSPELLATVAYETYRFPKHEGEADTVSLTLVELYGITGDTRDERTAKIVKRLQGRVSVSSDLRANTVALTVKAPYSELAKLINRRMLDFVNDFNLKTRQSQASAERKFIEQRMVQAQGELKAAEDSMQRFLEKNRTYQSSPRLTFEAARLQRRVDLHQQVYVTLAQAYEQARVEEVRNTPVITIIDEPELYAKRSRSPVLMGILGLFGGLVLAMAIALGQEYLIGERERDPEGYRRLRDLWHSSMSRLWRHRRQAASVR
jgi:uncharacterized protein involved in exopolysaccharide biosynthesis